MDRNKAQGSRHKAQGKEEVIRRKEKVGVTVTVTSGAPASPGRPEDQDDIDDTY